MPVWSQHVELCVRCTTVDGRKNSAAKRRRIITNGHEETTKLNEQRRSSDEQRHSSDELRSSDSELNGTMSRLYDEMGRSPCSVAESRRRPCDPIPFDQWTCSFGAYIGTAAAGYQEMSVSTFRSDH